MAPIGERIDNINRIVNKYKFPLKRDGKTGTVVAD
jgi:hypothetical protein